MPKKYFWFPSPSATRVITVEERHRRWKPQLAESEIDWAHPLARGLAGCWLLNEGAGSIVRDLAYGSNGTLLNMEPEDWVADQEGPALNFDKTTEHVSIANTTPINVGASNFSFLVSFRPDTVAANDDVLSKSAATTLRTVQMYYQAGNVIRVYSRNSGGSAVTLDFTGSFPAGAWYDIALVRDTGASLRTGYAAGRYNNQVADTIGDIADPSVPWRLADRYGAGDYGLDGRIRRFYLWDRVLIASEILQLYVEPFCFLKPRRMFVVIGGGEAPPAAKKRRLALLGVGR